MSKTVDSDFGADKLLIRFLLDELPAAEREAIEERTLADDDFFANLLAVEDELRDAYARGELSAARRRRFEARFLRTPDDQGRLAFARSLATVADEQPPEPAPAAPWWRTLFRFEAAAPRLALATAAALAVAIGAAYLGGELRGARRELAVAQRAAAEGQQALAAALARQRQLAREVGAAEAESRETARELARLETEAEALTQELAAARQRAAEPPQVLSFALSLATVVRGLEEPTSYRVPPGIDRVEFQLDLDGGGGYRSYRALLRTLRGGEVWSQSELEERATDWGSAVFLSLPATVLAAGDYELILLGLGAEGYEEVGFLTLRIRR